MDRPTINEIWEKLDNKLSKTAISAYDKLPYTTVNGVFDDKKITDVCWWTNGFWAAIMILMYSGTQNTLYLKTARHSMDIMDAALMQYDSLHHDVGFMWNISSGMDYRLTGNKTQRNRFLIAANHLMGRFNADAGFLRAWNDWGNTSHNGWAIIDCMMNIPLLYRASEEMNDKRFAMVANIHADKTAAYHVRDDGSCNHINEYNPLTGEFVKAHKGQGYAENSSWSRGQAWGLYGFALAYRYTHNEKYLNTAKRIAHYFIACTERTNWIPLCDFRQPEKPILYDTTAGACAACGLMEIADFVAESEKKLYSDAAVNMIFALEKECNWSENEDSVLQNGTEAYDSGHHMPIIYGDYFFTEAIYRLMNFNTDILW